MPTLLILLIALPLASAVGVAVLGFLGRRPEAEQSDGPVSGAFDGTIRWISLASTVVSLVVAAIVGVSYASDPGLHERPTHYAALPLTPGAADTLSVGTTTFRPQWVPGAEPNQHTTTWNILTLGDWASEGAPAIQFYVGVDGLNVWLVLLTCVLMVPAVL